MFVYGICMFGYVITGMVFFSLTIHILLKGDSDLASWNWMCAIIGMQLDRCSAKHGATRPKHGATRPKHWKASKRTLRVGGVSPSILALHALWGSSGQNRVTRYRSTCYSNTLHRRINDFVPDTTLMRWGEIHSTLVEGIWHHAGYKRLTWQYWSVCVLVRVRRWGNVRVRDCAQVR